MSKIYIENFESLSDWQAEYLERAFNIITDKIISGLSFPEALKYAENHVNTVSASKEVNAYKKMLQETINEVKNR